MTDEAGTTAPVRRTIDELANLAVSDPTKLAPAEVTRLGDWILDHEAHVMAHSRLVGAITPRDIADRRAARAAQLGSDESGPLSRRLAGVDAARPLPKPAFDPLPEHEHDAETST